MTMNATYKTINEVITAPLPIVSRINLLSSQVATEDGIASLGVVSGSSELYGAQALHDVLMISSSNQTIPTVHIATLAVCNVLIGIVVLMGCVGNGAVIVQVITNWNARFGFAPLILNLAVSDFLICSCLSPVFLIFLFRSPPTPNIFCGLFTFMGTICTLSSLLTMSAIALHRYRLMSSTDGQCKLSIAISLLTLIFIWALGFSVALGGILYVSSNWNDPFQKCELINVSNSNERDDFSDFAISFLAPVCALSFICTVASCLVMVWVARLPTCWKNACEIYETEAAKSDKKPKMTEVVSIGFKQLVGCFSMVDKETKMLYLVAILVAFLCWAPILIAQILTLSKVESLVIYQLKLCGIALVFLNSALHPYIYTEHGWRLKHRYRVCLHAAFDCHRTADQWSLGGGVPPNCSNKTDTKHPSVMSVGTVTKAVETTTQDSAVRTMTTMTVTGSLVETRVCDCNRSHGDLPNNVDINENIAYVGNNINNEFAGEIEDNDTLDSGIDRDALSEVDLYIDNEVECTNRQGPVNHQQGRSVPNERSFDSLDLTQGPSESSSYCADAAENLTVVLPPRNSTPTGPATGAVGSRGKSGGAIIARHLPLSSWSSAAPPHRHPSPTPNASPTQQRQMYHYHHLHHHHHVILFPNNSDCVGATADTATLHPQSCHAAGRREYEPVKSEEGVETGEVTQQEEVKLEGENRGEDVTCVHRNCEAFRQEVAAASASGNKAAEVLLRLLSIGETSSSSSSAPPPPQHAQPYLPYMSPLDRYPPQRCICPSRSASAFSTVVSDPDEDCPAQTPLISHCPQHIEPSHSQQRRYHKTYKIKGSEHWYPSHDDGVFVVEQSYPGPQHPICHPSQTHYCQEHCKCHPTHLQHEQIYPFYSHHEPPHEHSQTDLPSPHKINMQNTHAKSEQT